jgi:replicative DNA helicase
MLDHNGHLNQYAVDEAAKQGRPSLTWIAQIVSAGFTGTAAYYGQKIREESAKRFVMASLTRAAQRIKTGGWEAAAAVNELQDELSVMPRDVATEDDTWTLQDIMGLEIKDEDFTLPRLLRRNERLVLTGSEGGGKSVFVYQLLTGAAYGIDTFNLEPIQPQRVLFLDVENNEFQARNNLEKIVPTLSRMAPDVRPDWRSMKRRVVNLLDTKDKTDVIRRIVHYNPDILYMGTAYKLTDVTDETHRSTRAIQSVVDRIRQDIDCSVIIEHHAGHGFQNDRNNMRPEGSSYWLRWPDFGYGMQPIPDDPRRLMRLRPWRGDRADDREYPVALKGGSVFPWQPVYGDEWEAIYSDRYDKN